MHTVPEIQGDSFGFLYDQRKVQERMQGVRTPKS